MTEILFYHLTRSPVEIALPDLLQRTLSRGKRAVVKTIDPKRVDVLDGHLWSYQADSFLPHGSAHSGTAKANGPAQDNEAVDQPVWLTAEDENPNKADYLFLTDGAAPGLLETFERCVILFSGGDDQAVSDARGRWKALKEQGHNLTYWQQTAEGKWEEKG